MTSLNSFSNRNNPIAYHQFDQTAYRVCDHSQKAEQLNAHDFHQILDSFHLSPSPKSDAKTEVAKPSLLDDIKQIAKLPSQHFVVAG